MVTTHGKKRMKERCGINKKASERLATIAFEKGLRHNDTTGCLNKWVTSLWGYSKKANNIRLYGDKAYIFAGTTLITVIQIPNNLIWDVNRLSKKKKMGEEDKEAS